MQTSRFMIRLTLLTLLALGNMNVFADSYTFSVLPPGGSISGAAGAEIGWGYSITNNSLADWLVTTNLAATPFADATADASLFEFPILAPNTTVSVAFDATAGKGLFGLTWDSNVPTGFNNSGEFTLSAEWWSGDPFNGGSFLQDALDQSADFSATALAAPVTVPEPSSAALLLGGSLLLVWTLRLRRKRNFPGSLRVG
jgi:hypothetical protein